MVNANQTWWEWFSYWMGQDATSWHSLSWAMGGNPIVISIHLIASFLLAVTFIFLAGGTVVQGYKGGFFSQQHKSVNILFIVFLVLCGLNFVGHSVLLFTPIFWIHGGIKLLTALFAILTSIAYIRLLPTLYEYPTPKQYKELQSQRDSLKRKEELLNKHIRIWTDDVGAHILTLKGEQKELIEDLVSKGLPVATEPMVETTTSDMSKEEALQTLEKIKSDLDSLKGNIDDNKAIK